MDRTEAVVLSVAAWQGLILARERFDRNAAYQLARAASDVAGKPLLNIGCPRLYPLLYPCGDVCLDISERRLAVCQSPHPTLGDIRHIPFPDHYFGAAICSHVLEHLASVADAQQALSELNRVAGRVFIVSPSRLTISGWLHPEHQLWVDQLPTGEVRFEQR